jgi:hypothetical protein
MYRNPDELLKAMAIEQHVVENFNLLASPDTYFMLLAWGYDVAGSASGGVALGTSSIKFSADAELSRNYALFRRFDTKTIMGGTGAFTAIAETVDSLVLPKHVHDDSDIAAYTWIYSLIDADLKGSIGVSYGYDFNWVHEAKFAGLKGDIGLKIQASINASVGFTFGGRWAVIVGRDATNQVVRVRVFKRPTKGFNFALNAGANVQPSTGALLPEKMDDFIAAILGVYAPQLLKDLKSLEGWASGNTPLSEALANISSDYMLKFLEHVYKAVNGPNASFNPDQDFAVIRDKVVSFIKTWGGLDSKLSSLLWKIVPGRTANGSLEPQAAAIFERITKLTEGIANGSLNDFRGLLNDIPRLAGFFGSPVGQFAQTLAANGLLTAAASNEEFGKLQDAAKAVLPFLKDGQSEKSLLQGLHDWIDPRLRIEEITNAVLANTGDIKDGWLRAKIADFLEQRVFGLDELKKIDAMITTLHNRAGDYYAAGRKALNATYGASLAATYESTSATTALLDVEFDFGEAAADKNKLRLMMASAIDGDFTEILMNDIPGVKLRRGMLSHDLKRHTHIELRLPFYGSSIDHINSSLASVNSMDAKEGRLVVYQLDSSDEVMRISNRGGDDSRLALGATIPGGIGNAIRVHGHPDFTYSYSFRQASRSMRRDQLQYQIKPYIDQYVPNAFSKTPFDTWLSEMDRAVPHPVTSEFGFVLLSVDLSVPSQNVAAWLQAPEKEKSQAYMEMSIAIQAALKKIIPFFYFADVGKYADLDSAFTLIGYSALPAMNSARLDGSLLRLNTGQSAYWDWMDQELRTAILFSNATEAKLRAMLPAIYQRLQSAGMNDTAKFFEPGDASVRRIRAAVDRDDSRLKSLLFTEAEIIDGAVHAGLQLAKFRVNKGADIKQAVRSLAAFGAKITDTFNSRVSSIYGGDALHPLGTMLFVAAGQALSNQVANPTAMFRFMVLDAQAPFDTKDFLQGKDPESGIAIQQSIVNAS